MAKKPTPAKKYKAFSPIVGGIAAAYRNRKETTRFNKEDKAYQSDLKKMGATVNGGGRANVKPAGASNPATQKSTPKK